MRKSVLVMLLALLLALTCALPAAVADEATLEQATLNVWLGGPGKQKDSDAVWAYLNEQLADYLPNTTIQFLDVPAGEYTEKWSKAMASQESIDVAWFGWMLNIYDEIKMGSVLPMNDLIAQYGQDMAATLGEAALAAHTIDGEIYAIPCWQSLGALTIQATYLRDDVLAVLENKDFFNEYQALVYEVYHDYNKENLAKLYDMMEEYLAGAKAGGALNMGYSDVVPSVFGMQGHIQVGDSNAWLEWGDNTFTLNSEYVSGTEAAELALYILERNNKFWNDGYYRSDLLSAETTGLVPNDPAGSTCIGMHSLSGMLYDYYDKSVIDQYYLNKFGFPISCIQMQKDALVEKGYSTATVIPYTAKNPERAMMYINLMNSPKGADLYRTLLYGIEGTHYDMNDDGTVNVYGGTSQATSDWVYGQWKWAIGTCLNTFTQPGEDPSYWPTLQKIDASAAISPILNFTFDKTDVEIEVVNCTAIREEYKYMFVYDDYEAKFEERNAKLAAAGVESIIAAAQAQLTAYIEANGITGWPEL